MIASVLPNEELADVASAQRGHKVAHPELGLWDAMLELALQRVNAVLDFARNWSTIRQLPDYESQRAKCVFHLEWIFDDEPSDRFTFREMCRYSNSSMRQNVDNARKHIRAAFSPLAAREMTFPLSNRLRKHVTQIWLGNDGAALL